VDRAVNVTGDIPNTRTTVYTFLIALQSFGQSFLQPDITIFKQNLNALEELNGKQKLYEKVSSIF